MKHKLIIAVFFSVLAATHSVQAQSSSVKKLQQELEQKKAHANEVLEKAHQQQQQAKNERRQPNTSFQQQAGSNSSRQPGREQPLLNTAKKRDDINQ
jgi:predicted Holliday junction resolvase-like endonuclease